ncbi:MAG TPA: alanine--tRNA ligase [Bacilli bacterium]|nr:alanine--tRNA ligase [Bacilli bacterium]
MKRLTGQQIRMMWLDFFKKKGHIIVEGASLVPRHDPTLLWINSGVAAIKSYFDGSEIPVHKRLTNVQKSIRTNDIENVGYTARHHTFFEMLGNFSIGDYFRKEIVKWAYEILTSSEYFAMPKEKLYVTYNPNDVETRDLWIKEGLDPDHLIALEGNYWQIGSGPCGPNTEVFFDRGAAYDPDRLGKALLEQEIENDRYIEIWGIVFSQYNGIEGQPRDTYKELPSKNIDTGAGLERIACILQETPTNFETDLFFPLIEAVQQIATIDYQSSGYRPYRVIADHIRTLTFALSDNASFSNEGRGYVLRRLLRRALRYGRKIGINEPFLHKLVATVAMMMGDFYPYLKDHTSRVSKMILSEEIKFNKTLANGETILRKLIDEHKTLAGEDAFKLYDTYGFPIELSKEICQESDVKIDLDRFEVLMEAQRERARQARSDEGGMRMQSKDLLEFLTPSTFDYDRLTLQAQVIGLFVNGQAVAEIHEEGVVIFDHTPFYAESGGQVADYGYVETEGTRYEVVDVQKAPNGQHMHFVTASYGTIKLGDCLTLIVDAKRRYLTMRNHSSLHLLQKALIEVLGTHITQQGSYVCDEYGRFDFTNPGKVVEEDLLRIEALVNQYIQANAPRTIDILNIDEAKQSGAISPFDEKYGEIVRIITFGSISKEFCGGTHVQQTGDIGVFAIESEESIAAGIRRIVTRTGYAAYELLKHREKLFMKVRDQLKASSIFEVSDRVKAMQGELIELHSRVTGLLQKQAVMTAKALLEQFEDSRLGKILTVYLEGTDRETLVKITDDLKSRIPQSAFLLAGGNHDEIPLVVYLGPSFLSQGHKAGNLVKLVAATMAGSGGGRPDTAFGAGKDKTKFDVAARLFKDSLA